MQIGTLFWWNFFKVYWLYTANDLISEKWSNKSDKLFQLVELSRGILLERVFSTLRLIFSQNDFVLGLCIFNDVHNKVDFC